MTAEKIAKAEVQREEELLKWAVKAEKVREQEALFRGDIAGRAERRYDELRAQAMVTSKRLEEKEAKVQELKAEIRENLAARAERTEKIFAQKRAAVAQHAQEQEEEREAKHFVFEEHFTKAREYGKTVVAQKQDYTKGVIKNRRERYEKNEKSQRGGPADVEERKAKMEVRHARAEQQAADVAALKLKVGVPLVEHKSDTEKRRLAFEQNRRRLEEETARKIKSGLLDMEQADIERQEQKDFEHMMTAERQKMTRELLKTQTNFERTFKKLTKNKGGSDAVIEMVRELGLPIPSGLVPDEPTNAERRGSRDS